VGRTRTVTVTDFWLASRGLGPWDGGVPRRRHHGIPSPLPGSEPEFKLRPWRGSSLARSPVQSTGTLGVGNRVVFASLLDSDHSGASESESDWHRDGRELPSLSQVDVMPFKLNTDRDGPPGGTWAAALPGPLYARSPSASWLSRPACRQRSESARAGSENLNPCR
jgi:hypothetical protein